MVICRIFSQGRFHFFRQVSTLFSQVGTMVYGGQDLSSLPKRRHSKEIGRNQEKHVRCIIRGAEHRGYQTHRFDGPSPSIARHRIQGTFCTTLEAVRTCPLFPLLFLERLQNQFDSLNEMLVEHGCIARNLPVLVSQSQRIAKRVDLILPFMQFRLHLCQILLPFSADWPIIERIGIRINVDAHPLAVNHTRHHLLQMSIFIGQRHVWPHLSTRIPQPHCMNISRINERIGATILEVTEMNRGVKGVRKAVRKHPRQLLIGE